MKSDNLSVFVDEKEGISKGKDETHVQGWVWDTTVIN